MTISAEDVPDRLRRKRVGEIPLLLHLAKRLRFDELLGTYVPAHGNEKIPSAQSLLLLVLNITSGRLPLYELSQWTTDLDGRLIGRESELSPALFNDDRYARALDKLYQADRASLMTDLVLAMVKALQLDLSQLHNDSTSIKTCGQMPGKTSSGMQFLRGHSKDHRPDLKQIVFSLSLTADGAVPIHFKAYSGNRTDDTTNIQTWKQLRELAGVADFLYVDALASNGTHFELLYKHAMAFSIGVKPAGSEKQFEQVLQRQSHRTLVEWDSEVAAVGSCHGYRFTNGLSLNDSYPDLMVNYVEYWEVDKRGKQGEKGKQHVFTWATSLKVTSENVLDIARAGRTRWRVENETFNVLKNQGYHFEHNYGHGKQYLSSTLAVLMMLSFLVDQIQEHSCRVFQQARKSRRTKKTLWMQMRFMMTTFRIPDWQNYMALLIDPDTVSMQTGPYDSMLPQH